MKFITKGLKFYLLQVNQLILFLLDQLLHIIKIHFDRLTWGGKKSFLSTRCGGRGGKVGVWAGRRWLFKLPYWLTKREMRMKMIIEWERLLMMMMKKELKSKLNWIESTRTFVLSNWNRKGKKTFTLCSLSLVSDDNWY